MYEVTDHLQLFYIYFLLSSKLSISYLAKHKTWPFYLLWRRGKNQHVHCNIITCNMMLHEVMNTLWYFSVRVAAPMQHCSVKRCSKTLLYISNKFQKRSKWLSVCQTSAARSNPSRLTIVVSEVGHLTAKIVMLDCPLLRLGVCSISQVSRGVEWYSWNWPVFCHS